MGLKSSTVEQAKFEYSPLGNIFNKGLEKEDKKGLLKRLKNIEDHVKKTIGQSISLQAISYFSQLSTKAKKNICEN